MSRSTIAVFFYALRTSCVFRPTYIVIRPTYIVISIHLQGMWDTQSRLQVHVERTAGVGERNWRALTSVCTQRKTDKVDAYGKRYSTVATPR